MSELEESVDKSKLRPNEGEAALYGITYDDSSYDYMSHLRPLNAGGEGEVMLIAGPRGSGVAKGMKVDRKGKGKATDELFGLEGIQLPEGVLASRTERTDREVYASQAAIPEELQGLQPDMDPHLRQVLEALDDEAFVDSVEGEGDWFDELIGGGERGEDEGALADDFEFKEWGDEGAPQLIDNGEEGEWEDDNEDEDGQDETAETGEEGGETWMDRFKAFKEAGGHGPAGEEGDDDDANTADRSEMADTVGSLANRTDMMVLGGKKRRGKRGPSDATGMSMSSSSMFRNEGLRTLDERFDQVSMRISLWSLLEWNIADNQIEREYELDDQYDDDDFPDDETASIAPSFTSNFSTSSRMSLMSHASAVPDVSREDFDAILDDFLENYEVVGRKYKQSLGGTALTGPEKLRVLRAAIDDEEDGLGKEESRRRILEIERIGRGVKGAKEIQERIRVDKDEEKWDVETILSECPSHRGLWQQRSLLFGVQIMDYAHDSYIHQYRESPSRDTLSLRCSSKGKSSEADGRGGDGSATSGSTGER